MTPDDDITVKWEKRWADKRKRDAVRKVPILHAKLPPGWCRWCGQDVLYPEKHKKAGQRNERKGWHDACLGEYFLHSRPDVQRSHLIARDGEKCRNCGGAPLKVVRGVEVVVWDPKRRKGEEPVRYCEIDIRIDVQIEHVVPLWKVRHMPDADRVKYFGPGNLQFLCRGIGCHTGKTKAEAAERGHFNRLAKEPTAKQGRLWPSPKMQSTGFDKTLTKKMNGAVVARKEKRSKW